MDAVLDVVAGSTRASVAFFSSHGACYVCRIADVPQSTGHGVPVQKLFKLADGERIVSMLGFDSRLLDVPAPGAEGADPEPPFAVAVSHGGMCLRFSLRAHREPSTRAGRRYMRLRQGDEVAYVAVCPDEAHLACASVEGRALICTADEVSVLAGPGLGVRLIKLGKTDTVLAAQLLIQPSDMLVVERKGTGVTYNVSLRKYQPVSRGGKGHAMFQRGTLERVVRPPPEVPSLEGK